MRVPFPATGRLRDDILAEMRGMKTGDADWQHGRTPLYVFKATPPIGDPSGLKVFPLYFLS